MCVWVCGGGGLEIYVSYDLDGHNGSHLIIEVLFVGLKFVPILLAIRDELGWVTKFCMINLGPARFERVKFGLVSIRVPFLFTRYKNPSFYWCLKHLMDCDL